MVFSILDYSKNNYKHYIMPSLCASLKIVIIYFIGSSFKLLCNSALLCHYCTLLCHCQSFINLCCCITLLCHLLCHPSTINYFNFYCITLELLCLSFNLNDFKVYLYFCLCYTSTFVHDILVIYFSFD